MPTPQLFTVEQAEKTLPLVQRIVRDIVREYKTRESALNKRNKLPRQPTPGSSMETKTFDLEDKIQRAEENILRFQRELNDLGVLLKDYVIGLIDFYSNYEGRIVHLCWKLDEGPEILFWHELRSGFRGRQDITADNKAKFRNAAPAHDNSIKSH